MPARTWTQLRYRADGSDDPEGAAEPQLNEVSDLDGLPVRVITGNPPSWKYTHPASTTTTVVTPNAGVLHSIVINTTVASAITVYDGVSSSGAVIATFQASAGLGTYLYDIEFADGLTLVLGGASDVTVAWR